MAAAGTLIQMTSHRRDPASFDDSALTDAAIRSLRDRVAVTVAEPPTTVAGASIVTVMLKDGRRFTREVDEFKGTPARPLDLNELRDKFATLTRSRYGAEATGLFERLHNLENETELDWIGA